MSSSGRRKGEYHHGDLRNALIRAGVRLLQTTDADHLSLRQLAKEAGVSHNAPYMHFPDKEALIAAIAEQGFRLLSTHVQQAWEASTGAWTERFVDTAWAYVEFALQHPSHMQVMFRRYTAQPNESVLEAGKSSFGTLVALVEEGQQKGHLKAGDAMLYSVSIWSSLHGIAAILSADKLPGDEKESVDPKQLVRALMSCQLSGLMARPQP